MWPMSFMSRKSLQSIIDMPPPHHAQYMRLPRIIGGPCSVVASSCGCGSLPTSSLSVFIHGRPQMLTTSGLSGFLMSSVQITRLSQPGASFGMKASPRSKIDAETVRAGSRHIVEADRLGRRRCRNVENEKAGAGVLALVAGEPFRIHVEQIVADNAQLVAMDAGRRAEFADLLWLLRIAHVVDGKTFRAVEARAADGADIGVALVESAPGCRRPRPRSDRGRADESFLLLRGTWRAWALLAVSLPAAEVHSCHQLHGAIVIGQIEIALRIGGLALPPSVSARSASTFLKPAMSKAASRVKPKPGSAITCEVFLRHVGRQLQLVDQHCDCVGMVLRIERPA